MEEKESFCFRKCKNCDIDIYDPRVTYIEPEDILEWEHNIFEYIEDNPLDIKGVPNRYRITCSYNGACPN